MAALTTLAWLISSSMSVASALTDTTATSGISIGSPASAHQQAALIERPAVSSESDNSNDSFEDDDDGCLGAHGRNDEAWACGEKVDLGELADRVADALLGIDADERRVLGSKISIPPLSPTSRTRVEADARKVCGEEYLKMCSKGASCCNSSCLQIACGEFTRGGGLTKVLIPYQHLIVCVPGTSVCQCRRLLCLTEWSSGRSLQPSFIAHSHYVVKHLHHAIPTTTTRDTHSQKTQSRRQSSNC